MKNSNLRKFFNENDFIKNIHEKSGFIKLNASDEESLKGGLKDGCRRLTSCGTYTQCSPSNSGS